MKNLYTALLRKHLPHLLLIICAIAVANAAFAQTGVYDPTFGNGGKVLTVFDSTDGSATATAIQPDGKLVVVGFGDYFPETRLYIARYNTNGILDATFGNGGIVTIMDPNGGDLLNSVAIQPDGKIVAGGLLHVFDSSTQLADADFYLFRLKPNGSFDSTFGTNGEVVTDLATYSGDVLHKLIIKPNGKILAGGYVNDGNTGNDAYGLVQYNADGTLDNTFGTNGITVIMVPQDPESRGSIALLPNGKILAALTTVSQTGFYDWGLARFNADGTPDASFGTGGMLALDLGPMHDMVHDMVVQTDGKIVLTGESDNNLTNMITVVRVDNTGAYDLTFGDSGIVRHHISSDQYSPETGESVAIQPDGKILVGCTLDNAANSYDANFALVRFKPNGAIDDSFGRRGVIVTDFDNGGDFCKGILLQPDGKIVLVGQAQDQNYSVNFGIVRYLSNARLYYNSLKGSVFVDNNSNGVKDAGEEYFTNASLTATKGVDTLRITTWSGKFDVDVDTGMYVIKPANSMQYYAAVPASQNVNHNSYFNSDSISFAMQPIPGLRDLFLYIVPIDPARPGFNHDYAIVYINRGTDTIANGYVDFIKSNMVNVTSTVPVASSTLSGGDTLRWNFTNFPPRDTGVIIVHATVQAPPAVGVGDTLISAAYIFPYAGEQTPKDNFYNFREEVVGSYDPNDKSENHAGRITLGQVSSGDYMYYTIRFQNTGTDTAFNIYVRDTLSSKLDWSSIQMISASHNYSFTMDDNRCLWSFNNIGLVDKTHNEPKSHGYVMFRIKPKSNVVVGDNIDNTASIYFDFNLPVRTNMERTTVVSGTLPLKLLSFSAKKNGKTNLLQWSTASEVNVSHFLVERSINGIEYTSIGRVNAGLNQYSFIDNAPANAVNFYRLKMLDRDGRFEYSPVRTVNNSGSFYVSVYPNPANDKLNLQINIDKKAVLQLQVLSMDGRVLLSKQVNAEAGTSLTSLEVAALHSGGYLLKVSSTEQEQTVIKFTKL